MSRWHLDGMETSDLRRRALPFIVEHPIFFCPFCGSRLQSPDEVKAKVKAEAETGGEG